MIIRPLASDLDAWAALRHALWPHHTLAHLREEAEQLSAAANFGTVFLAQGEADFVGMIEVSLRTYAEGCVSNPVPYIEGLFVDEEYRNAGVGRLLLKAVEDWARGRGFTELASDTELDNTISQSAHEALGFEEADRIVCFHKSL